MWRADEGGGERALPFKTDTRAGELLIGMDVVIAQQGKQWWFLWQVVECLLQRCLALQDFGPGRVEQMIAKTVDARRNGLGGHGGHGGQGGQGLCRMGLVLVAVGVIPQAFALIQVAADQVEGRIMPGLRGQVIQISAGAGVVLQEVTDQMPA